MATSVNTDYFLRPGETMEQYGQRVSPIGGYAPTQQQVNQAGAAQGLPLFTQSPTPTTSVSLGTVSPTVSSQTLTEPPRTTLDIQSILAENQKLQQQYLESLKPSEAEVQLQNELAALNQRSRDFELSLDQGTQAQYGLGRPLELSTGRAGELERQAGFQRRALSSEQQAKTEQLGIAQSGRQATSQGLASVIQFSQQNLQNLLALQKATQPDVLGTQVNSATGDVYAFVRDPQTGAITSKNIGNVGVSKQYSQSGTYVNSTGQQVFWGLNAQGQIEQHILGGAKQTGGGTGGSNDALVQAVLQHPELYNQLTPTQKGAIAPALAAAGFSQFGKPLSDTAIKEISQTQAALTNLETLRQVMQDNLQYIGPISGLQALNPWSKARQVQAEIDRVRQIVGKALEGGVLRKEDEEKYKRILATITDTPETALYKINALINQITQDMQNYISLQGSSGRSVEGIQQLENPTSGLPSPEDLRAKYNY